MPCTRVVLTRRIRPVAAYSASGSSVKTCQEFGDTNFACGRPFWFAAALHHCRAMKIRVRILAATLRRHRSPLPGVPAFRGPPPHRRQWWDSLPLPYATVAVLTAQAAQYDAALERYVGAVLTDVAERGWQPAPTPGRRRVVVPLTGPPRHPPAA